MKKLLVSLWVLNLMTMAVRADVLIGRMETGDGREPSYTLGVCTNEGPEFWAFAVPNFPILEFGYTHYFPLGKRSGVLAGGYVSRWCEVNQWYAEPIAIGFTRLGDWKVKAFFGAYAPLNGGPWQLYSNPTQITTAVTPNVDLGVAGTCWFTQGAKPTFGFGPTGSLKVGDLTFSARALVGINQQNSVRFEVTCPF